ncbi:eukaryotic translation initiation factor 4E-binding protein 1 [Sigmodon hispidus]
MWGGAAAASRLQASKHHLGASTTPGGTRIIYDRKFLMECRNSPVAKTPPKDLPAIPGVTSPTSDKPPMQASQSQLHSSPEDKRAGGEESQFEMDI